MSRLEGLLDFLRSILPAWAGGKTAEEDGEPPKQYPEYRPEDYEWRPFNTVWRTLPMPWSSMDLLLSLRTRDWNISLQDYFAFLLQMCMLEVGFLPFDYSVSKFLAGPNTTPFMPLEEFWNLEMKDRMDRVIYNVRNQVRRIGAITVIRYQFIKAIPHEGGYRRVIGNQIVKAMLLLRDEGEWIHIVGTCEKASKLLRLPLTDYLHDNVPREYGGDVDICISSVFEIVNHVKFITEVKRSLCRVLIDKLGAIESNKEGLQMLPKEMLEMIAQHVDCVSFASLLQTNKYIRQCLNTELMWEIMCGRVRQDFPTYNNWPVPELFLRCDRKANWKTYFTQIIGAKNRARRNRSSYW